MKYLFLLLPAIAFGFPEMTRHGYPNCTTCHMSPNGGGVLTPYGRQLSQELLSRWSGEDEGKFLNGIIQLPTWLNLGGDLRAIQLYYNTPRYKDTKFILMQADVEPAITLDRVSVVGTIGRQEPTSYNKSGGTIFSRRHYINFRPTDELSFRAGRFQTAYGINSADHMITTKRGLSWDEGSETYNVEGSYLGETFDAFLTGNFGRPGVGVRSSVHLNEKFKLGASYFGWTSEHLAGPYAILGFSPNFFVLAELDYQIKNSIGEFLNYLRVDYEVTRGLHAYVTQEYSSSVEAYGIGLQFFPRPHFELQAYYQLQRTLSLAHMAWLHFHYYL